MLGGSGVADSALLVRGAVRGILGLWGIRGGLHLQVVVECWAGSPTWRD
jgi:hypothetical protein